MGAGDTRHYSATGSTETVHVLERKLSRIGKGRVPNAARLRVRISAPACPLHGGWSLEQWLALEGRVALLR